MFKVVLNQNAEPGTRNQKPGTRNPERGTWNPEPGTRNQEQGTRNPELLKNFSTFVGFCGKMLIFEDIFIVPPVNLVS